MAQPSQRFIYRSPLARHSGKRVVILPHVGVAMGHLLRAIALRDVIAGDSETLLALPSKARPFVRQHFPAVRCKWINWPFGHNEAIEVGLSNAIASLKSVTRSLDQLFTKFRPDVVIGLPGFQTSVICELLQVPHVSVLHGPWLTPDYELEDLSPGEKAVMKTWKRAIQLSDTLSQIMAHAVGYTYRGYREWFERQEIYVAQSFSVPLKVKRPTIGFLSRDYGLDNSSHLPAGCISILFGSAIPDIDRSVVRAVRSLGFPIVIAGARRLWNYGDLFCVRSIPATHLARMSVAAITHGGIGTIPAFAEAEVPQLFVPHDIDQAVNSILASRSGLGKSVDLTYWSSRSPFGRARPPVDLGEVQRFIRDAWQRRDENKLREHFREGQSRNHSKL